MSVDGKTACTGCGVQATELNAEGYCLDCEHAALSADMHAMEATLELIGDTIATALERGYVHGDDAKSRVARVIHEHARHDTLTA